MDNSNSAVKTSDKNNPYKLLNIQIRSIDMYNTMKEETLNFISNIFIEIAEKSVDDYDGIARDIKSYMDKQFGPPWHCVVGKGFGSGVTYNNKNMIFLYISNKAILIFRH